MRILQNFYKKYLIGVKGAFWREYPPKPRFPLQLLAAGYGGMDAAGIVHGAQRRGVVGRRYSAAPRQAQNPPRMGGMDAAGIVHGA